ncbi:ParA family protein [[Mycoplasma] gypis]|uniref:ParA family protein n=1 Tax=[Mycoplasma] gypis TaxID=92404 RepID=A0ABZ2RP66_9BACT|nr:ParA family protein [[Mycoplasma] gypis]MBN0919381.1 ParA family protein [[Mycoplasma] gypis]
MKTKIITYLNNKGGVLKTTLASNHAIYLSQLDYKVLIIDTDPQNNIALEFDIEEAKYTLNDVLFKNINYKEAIINKENIDIITCSKELEFFDEKASENLELKVPFLIPSELIQQIVKDEYYDYIIVDTANKLNNLLSSVLWATEHVIIPFSFGWTSLSGINNTINFIKEAQKVNKNLNIKTLVPVFTNMKTKLHQELRKQIQQRWTNIKVSDIFIKNSSIPEKFNTLYFKPFLACKRNHPLKEDFINLYKSLNI